MTATPFRFVGSLLLVGLASITTYAQSAGQAQQKAAQKDEFLKGAFLPDTPDLVQPIVVSQRIPVYASDAMRAKIQGVVQLEAVVDENGTVRDVRVTRSLDKLYGLDQEAMKAARLWLFRPARDRDNRPVPIIITLELEFRLH